MRLRFRCPQGANRFCLPPPSAPFSPVTASPSSSRHQRQNNRAASHLFREKLTMSGWYEKPDSLLQGCPARCCCSDCFTPAGNRREKAPDGFRAPFPVSLHYDERLRPAGWLFLFMPRSRKCSAKTFSEKQPVHLVRQRLFLLFVCPVDKAPEINRTSVYATGLIAYRLSILSAQIKRIQGKKIFVL